MPHTLVRNTLNFQQVFLRFKNVEKKLVANVESFDQTVGLDYLVWAIIFSISTCDGYRIKQREIGTIVAGPAARTRAAKPCERIHTDKKCVECQPSAFDDGAINL